MKIFRKAIVILLLMALAITLLPAAGLGEEESETEAAPEDAAFSALRKLIEEPLSETIPAATGSILYADITEAKPEQYLAGTPEGILCQILFNENKIIISGISSVQKDDESEEYEDKYTSVTYSDLTMEQMLYYAYVIGSNFNTIQEMMPFSGSYSIVAKYGDGDKDMLLINDMKLATEFTETIVNLVNELSGESAPAE